MKRLKINMCTIIIHIYTALFFEITQTDHLYTIGVRVIGLILQCLKGHINHHSACSTEETFLQDFQEIMKRTLHNFLKILKKCFLVLEYKYVRGLRKYFWYKWFIHNWRCIYCHNHLSSIHWFWQNIYLWYIVY